MSIQQQLVSELHRRSQLFGEEIATWQEEAAANVEGMGLHRSQLETLGLLFEELMAKVRASLGTFDPGLPIEDFARKRQDLEQELTASHGILAVVRLLFAQREDETYFREVLNAADLIAASCYRSAIERVRDWGMIAEEHLQVPPLTYLNTLYSPAAYTRAKTFGAFKMPLDGYRELKLPISVISLPFHHTKVLWSWCSIHHETGHILDQDLGLFGALRPHLEEHLGAGERTLRWVYWLREMIADALAVLLAGRAYASALGKVLLLPTSQVASLDGFDTHPTPLVRMHLLAALLRRTGVAELVPVADEIDQGWRSLYGEPTELKPFIDDCPAVAEVLLGSPLAALGDRPLCALRSAAEMADDARYAERLARYLRTGLVRPAPGQISTHLLPVAAELAAGAVMADHDTAFATIQERSLEYAAALRALAPAFLADEMTTARKSYYRTLVRNMDLKALQVETF